MSTNTIFKSVNNYLVFNNNQVVSSQLNDDFKVSTKKNTVTIEVFQAKKAVLQVSFNEINETIQINYIIHPNSDLKIIELRYFNQSIDFNRVVDIKEGAQVSILSFNEGNKESSIKINDHFKVGKDTTLNSSYGELSDCSIKAKYYYELLEVGSTTNIKTAALSNGTTKKEYQISLHHTARNTYGDMNNYGVCKDNGHLKFEGVGRIDKDMSASNSHQTSKIMVFDENCVAEANPLLYIDNFDVKAGHATGVGRMDLEQLYYLQSRGLNKDESKHLITMGYLLPIVKEMDDQEVTDYFVDILNKKVGK